jgi:hypothetical protein
MKRRHASLGELDAIEKARSIELGEIYAQGREANLKAEKEARETYDRLEK